MHSLQINSLFIVINASDTPSQSMKIVRKKIKSQQNSWNMCGKVLFCQGDLSG